MEYGPYFLNESGYVLQIITEPRELWNFNDSFNSDNNFYHLKIFTNGFIPILNITLNYKTIEKLFYNFTDIMSTKTVAHAFNLPGTSSMEKSSIVIYRQQSCVSIRITNKNITGDEAVTDIILSPNDAADFTNVLMKVYLEGSGLYELKEQSSP